MTVIDEPPQAMNSWLEHVLTREIARGQYRCARCGSKIPAEWGTPIGAGIYQQGATFTEDVPTSALRCNWRPDKRGRRRK